MRSRVPPSPDFKREGHKWIDQQLHIERAFIAHCIMLGCAVAAHNLYGFGKDRIQRLAAETFKVIEEYYNADPDTWPDMAQRDCQRLGVEFDGYWIKARDRQGNPVKLNITPEQAEYLEHSRTVLLSDAESKKIHDGWKAFK